MSANGAANDDVTPSPEGDRRAGVGTEAVEPPAAPPTSAPPTSAGAPGTGSPPTGAVAQAPDQEEGPDHGHDLAGLDALETADAGRVPLGRRMLRTLGPPILAIIVLIAVWQIYVWSGAKPTYVVPSPRQVWDSLWGNHHVELVAAWTSLRRAIIGFVIAVVVGTAIGLLVARVKLIRAAIKPTLTGLQSLPSVAWVPVAIIWFGITNNAIYFIILMGAVPSIAVGLVAGVDQVPPVLLRAGRVLGARRLTAIRHVLLPAALPGYLAGLKQGWAFAWRSLMAGELIANSPDLGVGLGRLLDNNSNYGTMADVIAAIVSIFIVGVGIELVVFSPVERYVLRSRGLADASR